MSYKSIVSVGVAALSLSVFADVKIPADKAKFKLVVLAGQSNMAGHGTIEPENNKPHPRVVKLNEQGEWVPCVHPIHYDTDWNGAGPGKAFAEALADSDPSIVVGVVPTSVGGTSIKYWEPGAIYPKFGGKWRPYDHMLARVRRAQQQGTIAAILWHQGESDEDRDGGYLYQFRFPVLIERMRKDLGAEGVPLIVGGLRDGQSDWFGKIISTVERWTCEYAFGPGKFVPCDPKCALEEDKIHYTDAAQRDFGKRYFAAYTDVMKQLAAKPDYWKDSTSEAAKLKASEIPGWENNKYNDGDKQLGLVPAKLPEIVEKWLFPNGRPASPKAENPAVRIMVVPETTDLTEDLNKLVRCEVVFLDAKGGKVTTDDRPVDYIAEGACMVVSSDKRSFTIRRTRPGAANVRAVAEGLRSGEYTFAGGEDEED